MYFDFVAQIVVKSLHVLYFGSSFSYCLFKKLGPRESPLVRS